MSEHTAESDADYRLSLIEGTCRDLLARIEHGTYNYGPTHVKSDLAYLLEVAKAPQVIPPGNAERGQR